MKKTFDLPPLLNGTLTELWPLRAADFDALYAVAADPLIWEQHPARDRYKEDIFRDFFEKALQSGGTLVTVDRRDGLIVGSSRFHRHDEEKGEIEIGWTFLARSHWGGVYNREMKQLMLRHAFLFVDSVILLVGCRNLRSQPAVEKIGGVREDSRRGEDGHLNYVYRINSLDY